MKQENKKIIKSAALIIKNNKLLVVKKKNNTSHFILPGGKLENGESKEETLVRELKEELNISVDIEKIKYLKTIVSTAQFENIPITSYLFLVDYKGKFEVKNEIVSYSWLDINNFNKEEVTPTLLEVVNYLKGTSC